MYAAKLSCALQTNLMTHAKDKPRHDQYDDTQGTTIQNSKLKLKNIAMAQRGCRSGNMWWCIFLSFLWTLGNAKTVTTKGENKGIPNG
jgi:hypothetical protein